MGCDDITDTQRAWLAGESDKDRCVRCGHSRAQVSLARSSASGFKQWVCASDIGCVARRKKIKRRVIKIVSRGEGSVTAELFRAH